VPIVLFQMSAQYGRNTEWLWTVACTNYEDAITKIITRELSKTNIIELKLMWKSIIEDDEFDEYEEMEGSESREFIEKVMGDYFLENIHRSAECQE